MFSVLESMNCIFPVFRIQQYAKHKERDNECLGWKDADRDG